MNINLENKKRVSVISPPSGCPMRCLEAVKIKSYFYLNNFIVDDSIENADYIIFVTCSVSPLQMNTSLETIRDIQKNKGELIVMGCLPGANEIELRTIFSGKVIASKNINELDQYFPDFRIKFHQVPEAHSYDIETFNLFSNASQTTSYIKLLLKYGFSKTFYRQIVRSNDFNRFIKSNIEYNTKDKCFIVICSGCTHNCSYCNIKAGIGTVKSRSIDAIVEEYSLLLKDGYRLFHFLADDLCSYGLDIKSSLIPLLEALSAADSAYNVKWSLHGFNPAWLVRNYKELIPLFKSKKVWDITLAVESGSNRIIKLMNRSYKIEEVEAVLKSLRKINSGLRIDALFFVGFPTETDDDFNDTLNIIKSVRFDDVRVTYYTEFERVASAKLFPKVSEEVIQNRLLAAEKLLKKIKADSSFLFRLQQKNK